MPWVVSGRTVVTFTKRRTRRFIKSLVGGAATVALVASTVAATSVGAQAAPDKGKIKPQLAQTLQEEGEATFWIRFNARPDLSKASEVEDWDQRGQAVYQLLTKTAKESQEQVRRELTEQHVDFQSFYATNAIRVASGSQELAQELASHSEVEALYPKRNYDLIDPVEKRANTRGINAVEWGIDNINADDVWNDFDVRGEGITVANIDTGVQFDHPALVEDYRGNNGDGTFDHSYNWFDAAGNCADAPCDNNGHGTHTMGTMMGDDGGENQIGVAPEANWIAANGCCPSDAALIASGEWMLAPTDLNGDNPDPSKRPHIINNSWGTQLPSNDPFMEDILEAWAAAGIFGAWANGNSGELGCESSGSPGSRIINYSVGAYDSNNDIAYFSGRGPGQDGEIKPNISAPGVNVRSSFPGDTYGAISGTSMATPHLAGAVALLWSAAPGLIGEVDDTRALLNDTAIDTEDLTCGGTADDNNVYGEGRLDALALINAAPIGDTGSIEGTVTDAATGDPLEGATVTITGPLERELTTGQDGTYSANLTVGDYTVEASKFGYGDQSADVSLPAGETVTQDFALEEVPSVSVNGQITDGSGHGWPLYAKISVEGAELSTYSNPDNGQYELSLPQNSTYTLNVESQYDGYETVTEEVEVGDSDMQANIDVPVDTFSCLADGYEYVYGDEAVSESFDTGELPDGWTVVDNEDNGQVWRFDDPDNRGNLTGGEGSFAIVDSDFYGSDGVQNTSLVSPVMDLADDGSPVLEFKQDLNNWINQDLAEVDVSVDGGATWENLLSQTTDFRGPDQQTLSLPSAANQDDVQIRFHYEADYGFWWQVDDVMVRNRTCEPVEGGLVVGNVHDVNTGDGVNGATVTSVDAPDVTATTASTPDDPALDDGFYWMFSSLTGQHPFEASAGNYGSQITDVDVAPSSTTRADFQLPAAQLSVKPGEVSTTLRLGDRTSERDFTVTNNGGKAAEVEFSERRGDFEILRADGARMTQSDVAKAEGAPLQRLDVPTSFAAHPENRMSTQTHEPGVGVSADPWTDITDYPNNVMDNRVVTVDGTTYSIAGGSGSASTGESFRYDTATLSWEPIASVPEPRNAMAIGAVDGQIVATGGWAASGPGVQTWVYDPAADTWTEAADAPVALSASGQAVVDGVFYAVGGCTTSACTPMSNAVMAYDIGSDSWTQVADYPEPAAFASCGGIEGTVYCTGGNGGTGGTAASYAYDPGSNTWTEIADAPVDTWASQYAVANGQLMVNGGVQGGVVTNATFAYDPATDSWGDLPNSNTARYRGAAGCGLYKVGGSSGGFNATPDSEVLPGFADCAAGGADVEWMSIDTTTATLAPGESTTVTVTVSADVDQPGTYTAGVGIKEDTPYSVEPVDVTMNVMPPRRWSKLAGTVTGVACDTTSSPLPGATVQVDSRTMDWTFSTDANGQYARWIDRRNNPLTVIASKDGYKPQSDEVRLLQGQTTIADFALEEVGC